MACVLLTVGTVVRNFEKRIVVFCAYFSSMEDTPNFTSASFIPLSDRLRELNQSELSHKQLDSEKHRERQIQRRVLIDGAPWKLKQEYSCGIMGLHEEMEDFYQVFHPTEQEADIRLRVVEHITRIVHSLWPHAKVEVFGSFRTGLYLPSSDIDMVIIGEWRSLPLSTLSKELEKNGVLESDINIIANATVPIVRLLHSPTRIRVDISFNMTNGVKSAKLIKTLMKQYPALPKLVLVLKQFLIQRGLNEVYNGGMSSYCLTLLIVSLLQGHHKPKSSPSLNLGTLLIEFFEHYGINFNYEKVSIHFESEDANYQPKQRTLGTLLSVEDPLRKGNDLAKGTYLMHLLKQAFQNAFHTLHELVTDSTIHEKSVGSCLSSIITVDEEHLKEREWMAKNYSNILRKISPIPNVSYESQNAELSKQSTKMKKKKIAR